ncbi:regulator of nonsense transcripts 3A isoform X4 [Macaca fascicularis]|uniref:regulator of nonsense transcripts 3A isoform X4 n=1 Tax=Macaca fascicularis TaxID=9541 RepID=UPI0032B02EE7
MRSEKEGAGGPRAAVAARGPCGREKLSALEVQFHRDSPQREAETQPTSSSGCGGGAGKPREEKRTALSKVVIRRLPPGLTKEQLEEQLRPLPAHDYFEFFAADLSLYPHLYSRAYINFRNPDDILLFRDRFDGYIFLDSKGLEYPAVVEFAPFQKIAKKKLKKKDAKTGSIEDDPEYKKFLETYCVEEEKTSTNPETLLGEMEAKTRELIGHAAAVIKSTGMWRDLKKKNVKHKDTMWMTAGGTELTTSLTGFPEGVKMSRDGGKDLAKTEGRRGARTAGLRGRPRREWEEHRGVTTVQHPERSDWQTRTGRPCSCMIQELASEHESVAEVGGSARQKVRGLVPRRGKRQSESLGAPGLHGQAKESQKRVKDPECDWKGELTPYQETGS